MVCPFECATSVLLELPDGTQINVPFGAPIDVTGGHAAISSAILSAVLGTGYSAELTFDDPLGDPEHDCKKGNDDVPGIFISSEVRVLGLYGNQDCSSSSDGTFIPFDERSCED
jgi:hypothetical protein